MAKGAHQPAQRVVLPNGMWLLLYENGNIKLAGYDRTLHVTEVLNRDGGAHIFARVTTDPDKPEPRSVSARADDLVTVERSVMNALRGIGQK
jgi:Ni,Fe-hydrogenase III component G